MAGPTLSRFLGLFRMRDASDPTRVASVGADGKVATSDTTVATRLGEVQASPTANTVLDRLKAIGTALAGALTVQGAGSAGTPAGGVMTAQGVSGMRPLDSYTIDPTTGEPYDPTLAAPVVLPKSTTFVTAQTSVGPTAGGTKLFNLNPNAVDRLVRCITQDMYIGPNGVTAGTGFLIKKDEPPIRWPASVGEVYGITATGSATAFTFEQ